MNKLLKIFAGGFFIFLLAVGVYLGISAIAPPEDGSGVLFPVANKEKTTLGADNILREEVKYLCDDIEIIYQGMVPETMWGKEISDIIDEYPAEQGWIIDNTSKPLIVLTKNVEEFCPKHINYRHLGVAEDKLAIYEGPLGCNQKILRVEENLAIDSLSSDFKETLLQGMKYYEQNLQKQEQLKKHLEFNNDSTLNAALENLDEMN